MLTSPATMPPAAAYDGKQPIGSLQMYTTRKITSLNAKRQRDFIAVSDSQ